MAHPIAERQQAAVALSAELGAPDPGDADWGPDADERCAQAPDLKLGDYFAHFQ